MNASGFAVIGTVDDAIAQIQRLIDQSGGFGTFLTMAHDWAPREATWHSYELLARYVFPEFQGRRRAPRPAATGPPRTGRSSSTPPPRR